MPWKSKQATKHTKKAKSPKAKRQWAKVANAVLKKGGSEGSAVRIANAAVKKRREMR
jgi:uncharacterized protein YdaT